jgi:hypothetical protein
VEHQTPPEVGTIVLTVYEPVIFTTFGYAHSSRTVKPGTYAARTEVSVTEKGSVLWALIDYDGVEVGRPRSTLAALADAGKVDITIKNGEVLDDAKGILERL